MSRKHFRDWIYSCADPVRAHREWLWTFTPELKEKLRQDDRWFSRWEVCADEYDALCHRWWMRDNGGSDKRPLRKDLQRIVRANIPPHIPLDWLDYPPVTGVSSAAEILFRHGRSLDRIRSALGIGYGMASVLRSRYRRGVKMRAARGAQH